jgi:hypothetical protein
MRRGFERLVVPVAGSDSDHRLLDLLPDLFSEDGGTVTFLFVVTVPQSMPLDAELPAEVERGELALRRAEKASRQTLPHRSAHLVTELLRRGPSARRLSMKRSSATRTRS